MSRFKSTRRTVVSEIKAFIVDQATRSGVFRQSVSAKLEENDNLSYTDINVSENESHELGETSAVLAVHCPEMIELEFEQTGEHGPIDEPEDPKKVLGVITTPDIMTAGNDLFLQVDDPDTRDNQNKLLVTVLNEFTGETEYVTLDKTDPGVFKGKLPTTVSQTKGIDFDSNMNTFGQQKLRVIYTDNTIPDGQAADISNVVDIKSPYVDSTIETPGVVFPNKHAVAIIRDSDVTGDNFLIAVFKNKDTGEYEEVSMEEDSPGTFHAFVKTVKDTSGVTNDGILSVSIDDTIEVKFEDQQAATQPIVTSDIKVKTEYNVEGEISSVSEIEPGETFSFKIRDYNLASENDQERTLDVPVTNKRTKEYEIVKCVENPKYSGILVGTLTTEKGFSEPQNDKLGVEDGDNIEIVYADSGSNGSIDMVRRIISVKYEQTSPSTNEVSGDIIESQTFDAAPQNMSFLTKADNSNSSVKMRVNGLFYLNGSFPGKVIIHGLNTHLTRCTIVHV